MNRINIESDIFLGDIEIGDIVVTNELDIYIIAFTGDNEYSLINLRQGSRYTSPVESLEKIAEIIKRENMAVYQESEFKLTLGNRLG